MRYLTALILSFHLLFVIAQTPDPNFGINGNGKANFDLGSYGDAPSSMQIQADGKIVLVGLHSVLLNQDDGEFTVVRLTDNGSPDLQFNGSGYITETPGMYSIGYTSLLYADNRILAAGSVQTSNTNSDLLFYRYNSNGSRDNTFNTTGEKTISISPEYESVFDMAFQSNGKIVFTGFYRNQGKNDVFVGRLNSNGDLDVNFGDANTPGYCKFSVNAEHDVATAIAVKDDTIYIAGTANHDPQNVTSAGGDFFIARLTPNGRLDNTFGTNGFFIVDLGLNSNDQANDLLIQRDGKIVVAGEVKYSGSADRKPGLVRINPNGSLDNSFGSNGKVLLSLSGGDDRVYSLVQDSDKLILAGYEHPTNGDKDFALIRLNSDGSPDNTFGSGGKIVADFQGLSDGANCVAIDRSKGYCRLIAAGYSGITSSNSQFALVSYIVVDCIVSIQDIENEIEVHLFPNPTSGMLKLEFENNDDVDIAVVDTKGQIVIAQHARFNAWIDVSTLPSGMYFVKGVSDSDKYYYARFVKM